MKNTFKLFLVSTLLITSGTLFAGSLFDTSDVRADQKAADEETAITRDDDKIIINANKTLKIRSFHQHSICPPCVCSAALYL